MDFSKTFFQFTKNGEAFIVDQSGSTIKKPDVKPVVKLVSPTVDLSRFVPILPNVKKADHAKDDVIQNQEWTDGLPCSSKKSENTEDEITFDVAAEQEVDIKSELIEEEDFTADGDVTTDNDTSIVEVKTEVEMDPETLNLKSETNPETANRTMILPVLNSQKKMSILYPKNVVANNSGPSNSGWWRMNNKLTGFRSVNSKGSGKETNKEFYVGIIRCSNCNTTNTTLWRKFGDTGEYGCNSCVLYWKVNGVSLFHVRIMKRYYKVQSRDLLLSTLNII